MLRWGREKETGISVAGDAQRPAVPAVAQHARTNETPPPLNLPDLLMREGHLSEQAVAHALEIQQRTGEFLGDILVREGTLDEKSLTSLLAKTCKIPHLSLLDYLIEEAVVGLVPEEICLRYRLLPIDKLGRNLTVAMVNPLDQDALQAVRDACPDLRVKPILCANRHFSIVANRLFKPDSEMMAELSASGLGLTPRKPAPAVAPGTPVDQAPAQVEEEMPEALFEEAPDDGALDSLPVVGAPHEELAQAVFADVPEDAQEKPLSDSVVENVTTVMIDSMRETYALLARRMHLFRGIQPEDVVQFFSRGMSVEYNPGEVVFEAGALGDELFLILSGEVLIFNEHLELAVLSQGDMFGEMSLVSQAPRSASARALGRASLLRLTHESLWNLLPREVALQVMVNIAVTLSDRLRRSNETVAQLPEHKAALVDQATQLSALEAQHQKRTEEARRLEQALVEMQDAVIEREQEQSVLEERIQSLLKAHEEARSLAEQFLRKLQE